MPVTRHPPPSPGRAVFPHPVPRLYSLPRKAYTMPCLLFPAVRFAHLYPIQLCPACVSFAGYVLPSRPSPCTWLSHAQSTMLDTTPIQPGFLHVSFGSPSCFGIYLGLRSCIRVSPSCLIVTIPYAAQESNGPPKFLDASLHTCHGL